MMQAKAVEGLLRLDTDRLPAAALARLLDVACRIERDALALSSSAVLLPSTSDEPVKVRVTFTENWPTDEIAPVTQLDPLLADWPPSTWSSDTL
jgi:hypothetical protein